EAHLVLELLHHARGRIHQRGVERIPEHLPRLEHARGVVDEQDDRRHDGGRLDLELVADRNASGASAPALELDDRTRAAAARGRRSLNRRAAARGTWIVAAARARRARRAAAPSVLAAAAGENGREGDGDDGGGEGSKATRDRRHDQENDSAPPTLRTRTPL